MVIRAEEQPQIRQGLLLLRIGLPPNELQRWKRAGHVDVVEGAHNHVESPIKSRFSLPPPGLARDPCCKGSVARQRQRKQSGRR